MSYGGIFRFHVKLNNVFSTLLFPWPSGLAADQYWARVQWNRFFSTVSSFAALAPFHRAASLMIKGSMPLLSELWGPSWKWGCRNLEKQLQYVPFTHFFPQNDMWQNVIRWNKYIHSKNGKQRCQKVQVKACQFSTLLFLSAYASWVTGHSEAWLYSVLGGTSAGRMSQVALIEKLSLCIAGPLEK